MVINDVAEDVILRTCVSVHRSCHRITSSRMSRDRAQVAVIHLESRPSLDTDLNQKLSRSQCCPGAVVTAVLDICTSGITING